MTWSCLQRIFFLSCVREQHYVYRMGKGALLLFLISVIFRYKVCNIQMQSMLYSHANQGILVTPPSLLFFFFFQVNTPPCHYFLVRGQELQTMVKSSFPLGRPHHPPLSFEKNISYVTMCLERERERIDSRCTFSDQIFLDPPTGF